MKTSMTPQEIERLKQDVAEPVTTGLTDAEIAAKQEAMEAQTKAEMARIRSQYQSKGD